MQVSTIGILSKVSSCSEINYSTKSIKMGHSFKDTFSSFESDIFGINAVAVHSGSLLFLKV